VIDILLSDEKLTAPTTPGDVYWALGDNLNTVRDIARYDPQTDTTSIVNHRVFDAFGNVTSETNAAVDLLFAFTGRLLDDSTGLQNNLHRWYDPTIGRWLSEDPIGFKGGDHNLYRYVNNAPTAATDPTGLWHLDIHRDLTVMLAAYAAFYYESYQIGYWNNAVDSQHDASSALVDYGRALEDFRNGRLGRPELNLAFARFRVRAAMHFPLSANGLVEPNSAAARAKMEDGLARGDLRAFSEGVHTLQDSWSHQGRPSVSAVDPNGNAVFLVGDARGGRWVVEGPATEKDTFVPVQGPLGQTIPVKRVAPLTSGKGHYDPYPRWRLALQLDASADDARYWPADVRAAGLATYKALVAFRERWPTPMRTRYPAASQKVVEAYLIARFPGGNVYGSVPAPV
jgi:RHS repeat-associated protein